jgi:hypothetical protein
MAELPHSITLSVFVFSLSGKSSFSQQWRISQLASRIGTHVAPAHQRATCGVTADRTPDPPTVDRPCNVQTHTAHTHDRSFIMSRSRCLGHTRTICSAERDRKSGVRSRIERSHHETRLAFCTRAPGAHKDRMQVRSQLYQPAHRLVTPLMRCHQFRLEIAANRCKDFAYEPPLSRNARVLVTPAGPARGAFVSGIPLKTIGSLVC